LTFGAPADRNLGSGAVRFSLLTELRLFVASGTPFTRLLGIALLPLAFMHALNVNTWPGRVAGAIIVGTVRQTERINTVYLLYIYCIFTVNSLYSLYIHKHNHKHCIDLKTLVPIF
jgi:hypothetical protein